MLRRLLNLPISVASRAAKAFQDREDARTREKYATAHDPGSVPNTSAPPQTDDPLQEDSSWGMDQTAILAMITEKRPLDFVDVRDTSAFARSHLHNSTSMPLNEIGTRVSELPPDRLVVVLCENGQQSLQAVRFFRERGMEDTWYLKGGLAAWKNTDGLPALS